MNMNITGERLFLLYAWPCAILRLNAGEIGGNDYIELERLVKSGADPKRALLAHCFPNAYRGIGSWSYDSVAHYWRNLHCHEGKPRDVRKVMVIEIMHKGLVKVKIGDRGLIFVNEYELSLQVGDIVFTHKNTIIEKTQNDTA